MVPQSLCEPFPEVLARCWIVEQVTGAQDRIHAVTSTDVQNLVDYIHPGARELLLRFLRKRREPPSQMPISRVEDSQHDVFPIRNGTWNSRVTVGARYRSS